MFDHHHLVHQLVLDLLVSKRTLVLRLLAVAGLLETHVLLGKVSRNCLNVRRVDCI